MVNVWGIWGKQRLAGNQKRFAHRFVFIKHLLGYFFTVAAKVKQIFQSANFFS